MKLLLLSVNSYSTEFNSEEFTTRFVNGWNLIMPTISIEGRVLGNIANLRRVRFWLRSEEPDTTSIFLLAKCLAGEINPDIFCELTDATKIFQGDFIKKL